MKRFLVSKEVGTKNDINVGIAPGKFDTKQLILSAITVLASNPSERVVRFVRTIEREILSKCNLFINDDFTTMFPVIPSYHDVQKTWDKNCKNILKKYEIFDEESLAIVSESVKEKICDLESIDCIMELYEPFNMYTDSFEEALNITIKLIEKFITDSVKERIYFMTVKMYILNATGNYITPPIYVQGWRSIVKSTDNGKHIQYAIFSENNNAYIIEALNKDIIMKKYVKGMCGICYSGRFFIKVTDMKTALKVIDKLPKIVDENQEKYA